jgi:hypothetical protein
MDEVSTPIHANNSSGYARCSKWSSRVFEDTKAFEALLMRPHHFIFNREWYEALDGRAQFEDFLALSRRLSDLESQELLEILSKNDPSKLSSVRSGMQNSRIRNLLAHYLPLPEADEREIWRKQKALQADSINVPDDELVEDAGLQDEVLFPNSGVAHSRLQASFV